jgi:TRAP-type mannitol/chloroaromatic compound transport system permease small subunit
VIGKYVRIVDKISDYTGYLAASLIFVMGGVMIFDAFTRNVTHTPVHWAIEFTQFTLAAYYFMGGPITLKNNDHVRMDLLYGYLSPRGKAKMDLHRRCMIFFLGVSLPI